MFLQATNNSGGATTNLGTVNSTTSGTQTITWNKNWAKYGVKFQHISHDPIGFTDILNVDVNTFPIWNDYSYSFIIKQKYKNILFNTNIEWVNSKNYLWKTKPQVNNLFISFNTIYIW